MTRNPFVSLPLRRPEYPFAQIAGGVPDTQNRAQGSWNGTLLARTSTSPIEWPGRCLASGPAVGGAYCT